MRRNLESVCTLAAYSCNCMPRSLIMRRIAASPSAARSSANRSGIYRVKWYRRLAFRLTLIAISPTCVVLFALHAVMRECVMWRAAASRIEERNRFSCDLSPSFIIHEQSYNGWLKCLGTLCIMYAENTSVICKF